MATGVLFELNLDQELPAEIKDLAVKQGENDDTRCELIEQFRRLIFEKGECAPPKTDDEFLMKFLRARYWKIESSYYLLCNYCKFRENNLNYYDKVSCLNLIKLAEEELVTVTPYRDQCGRRILIIRFGTWNPNTMSVDDIFRLILVILEMGSMEPISQVVGGIGIFDLSGLNMSHVIHFSPSIAQKIIALIVTSSPLRTTAIHIVNQSWIFNIIINVFKPLLNAKMKEKLFIHGSNMNSLHKHIHKECLPKRFGGVHEDYPYSMWTECLKAENKIKLDLIKLGYIVDTDD